MKWLKMIFLLCYKNRRYITENTIDFNCVKVIIPTQLDFNFVSPGRITKLKANFVGNSVEKTGFYIQFRIKIDSVFDSVLCKQRP